MEPHGYPSTVQSTSSKSAPIHHTYRTTRREFLFNTIRLCAANIDSSDLAMPNFYWYEQFGQRKVIKETRRDNGIVYGNE